MDGLSSRTISYTMTILGSILEQAVKDDIIPKNYMKNIDRPKQVKVRHMVTLSADEVKDFLSNISNTEHHALFKLAFATGMRRSELLGLRWSDIDSRINYIHFTNSTQNRIYCSYIPYNQDHIFKTDNRNRYRNTPGTHEA